MAIGFTISVSTFWDEQQTDCSPCYLCKEVIVTNMFRLVISAGPVERFNTTETPIRLCASCMEIVNEQKK